MGKQRRRGSGEGTITQREDGRWMAQLSLGFDAVTGRRLRETVYGDTQAEVREKLHELKQRFWEGGPVVESKMPLRNFLDQWLASVKDSVAEKSYDRYELDVSHLNLYLGTRPLNQLTGFDLTKVYQKMAEDGHTVAARYAVGKRLRQALAAAIKGGYVRKNVAKDVPLPRPERADIRPLTAAEAVRFLEVARTDRLFALYYLALESGARLGELLALEWADWNPVTRELTITKTLQEKNGQFKVKVPKTKASRRKILLSEGAAAVLEAHRGRQQAQHPGAALLFRSNAGGYLQKSHISTRYFKPVLSRAGLPPIRFHDLRHTCATLLLTSGVDVKTVAERLGHASVTTTLQVYAHILPSSRQQAATLLGVLLGGSKLAVKAVGQAS